MPTPNVNSYPDPFSGDAILADWGEAVDLDIRYLYTAVGSGAADASASVKGITKLSVAPVSSTNPIAVGDNDPRVPTTNEAAALVGSSGAPSAINPYVTESDARLPTAGEAAALAGTFGTPGSGNKYVTDDDPRLAGLGPGGLIMIRDSFTMDKFFRLALYTASYTVSAGKKFYVTGVGLFSGGSASGLYFTPPGGSLTEILANPPSGGTTQIGCQTALATQSFIGDYPLNSDAGGQFHLDGNSSDTYLHVPQDYLYSFPAGTILSGSGPGVGCAIQGFEV